MTRIIRLSDESDRSFLDGASCAFGVFDGIHRGHRFLIGKAREEARENKAPSVVLTFSIDPDELFAPERLMKIMTNEDRISALAETGVDMVAILPFDEGFSKMAPGAFLEWMFRDFTPAGMHVGEGFRFGCRGAGDIAFLEEWGACRGMSVHGHDLFQVGGAPVSSTRIRGLISQNRIEEAKTLLGASADVFAGLSREPD